VGQFESNRVRRLAMPKWTDNWLPTSLQQRLLKMGGQLVKHARCFYPLSAKSHLTRGPFGVMLGRIAAPPLPAV
jgi:hypothetical protein